MDLSRWSNSAGGNTASPPDGWPEGQAPSTVNNCARENMAAIRRWYEDAEWINLGHTPTYATTANFTIAGDQTTAYHAGRRIKAYDASTLYGKIDSASYSTNTRISVTWDSGAPTASLSSVAISLLSFNNHAIPNTSATATVAKYANSANATTIEASTGESLKTKIVSIGKWNMNASGVPDTQPLHGLADHSKIRTVDALVRHDTSPVMYRLGYQNSANETGSWCFIGSATLNCGRQTSSFFDRLDFSATQSGGGDFIRGWVTITYEV